MGIDLNNLLVNVCNNLMVILSHELSFSIFSKLNRGDYKSTLMTHNHTLEKKFPHLTF